MRKTFLLLFLCLATAVQAGRNIIFETDMGNDVDDAWALDMLHNKEIDMVVNVPKNLSTGELTNGYKIRRAAIDLNVPLITNARLASAFIYAFCTVSLDELEIRSWQEF